MLVLATNTDRRHVHRPLLGRLHASNAEKIHDAIFLLQSSLHSV